MPPVDDSLQELTIPPLKSPRSPLHASRVASSDVLVDIIVVLVRPTVVPQALPLTMKSIRL